MYIYEYIYIYISIFIWVYIYIYIYVYLLQDKKQNTQDFWTFRHWILHNVIHPWCQHKTDPGVIPATQSQFKFLGLLQNQRKSFEWRQPGTKSQTAKSHAQNAEKKRHAGSEFGCWYVNGAEKWIERPQRMSKRNRAVEWRMVDTFEVHAMPLQKGKIKICPGKRPQTVLQRTWQRDTKRYQSRFCKFPLWRSL